MIELIPSRHERVRQYMVGYRRRPEVVDKRRAYMAQYMREWKQRPGNLERYRAYQREYARRWRARKKAERMEQEAPTQYRVVDTVPCLPGELLIRLETAR